MRIFSFVVVLLCTPSLYSSCIKRCTRLARTYNRIGKCYVFSSPQTKQNFRLHLETLASQNYQLFRTFVEEAAQKEPNEELMQSCAEQMMKNIKPHKHQLPDFFEFIFSEDRNWK